MGRITIALGTSDSSSCVVDRSAGRVPFTSEERSGDSTWGAARTGRVLPVVAACAESGAYENETGAEADVIPPQLWFQLALTERERFGHCFSCLVLKALEFEACSAREVMP
jgi:hypothetical protein